MRPTKELRPPTRSHSAVRLPVTGIGLGARVVGTTVGPVGVGVGVGESVGVGVGDPVGDSVGVGDPVGDDVGVGVGDSVGEGVGVGVGVGDSVGVGDGVGDSVGVGVGDGGGDTVGLGLADRLGDGLGGTITGPHRLDAMMTSPMPGGLVVSRRWMAFTARPPSDVRVCSLSVTVPICSPVTARVNAMTVFGPGFAGIGTATPSTFIDSPAIET